MQKLLIITGLTASGKSGLAMEIAQKYGCEIISCDSVQVYRGLNIGSAKESIQNRTLVKHHLIDIVDPKINYSVGMFVKDCQNAINDCISRDNIPILVGGTMMYIKAVMEGYSLGHETNMQFRKYWQDYAEQNGKQAVWRELDKLNPALAEKVHYNNLNRVIRYLEFAKFGEPTKQQSILQNFDILAIGINENRATIYDKINKRVDEMIDMGLVDEVKKLVDDGLNLTNNSINTIGYNETYRYLTGEISLDRCIELIKQHTRNYAKRQLTFMKTIQGLKIVDKAQAKILIEEFLKGE